MSPEPRSILTQPCATASMLATRPRMPSTSNTDRLRPWPTSSGKRPWTIRTPNGTGAPGVPEWAAAGMAGIPPGGAGTRAWDRSGGRRPVHDPRCRPILSSSSWPTVPRSATPLHASTTSIAAAQQFRTLNPLSAQNTD